MRSGSGMNRHGDVNAEDACPPGLAHGEVEVLYIVLPIPSLNAASGWHPQAV
jgi:hypothetical protein